MKKSKLKWNVFAHHIGEKEIEIFNIFDHGRFRESILKSLKKAETKKNFANMAKGDLFYYFGSKCEWEIVLTSWPTNATKEAVLKAYEEIQDSKKKYGNEPYRTYISCDISKKIDVYEQVKLNFDIFVDYVWSFKKSNKGEK